MNLDKVGTNNLWAPGVCFARAKTQIGKPAWYSATNRMVLLLEVRRLTLNPRDNEEAFEFLQKLTDLTECIPVRPPNWTTKRWELYWLENMFPTPIRKHKNRHLLDVLYVKLLDQKIIEEVFRIAEDPFWTGRLIL